MRFTASQPKGKGTDVHAVILMEPCLKKHKDLREAMLRHEKYEIADWGKGCGKSHHHAKRNEPKLTRNLTLSKFWREIDRREK
jgi:hypothetical protein